MWRKEVLAGAREHRHGIPGPTLDDRLTGKENLVFMEGFTDLTEKREKRGLKRCWLLWNSQKD